MSDTSITELDIYKEDKVYFHLPDYSQHFRMNYLITTLLRDSPGFFYPDIEIGSVYGSFPSAIWNGGRVILGGLAMREDIIQCYSAFNDIGVPLRHTFTNSLIDDKLIYDQYCNEIMRIGDNGLNQVLVNSPDLEKYIRETYPSYPIISSTTKRIKDLDQVKEELNKGFGLVVLDYALNRNQDIFFLGIDQDFKFLSML